jgi:hypothetical protein
MLQKAAASARASRPPHNPWRPHGTAGRLCRHGGGDTPPVGVPGDYLKQFPVVEIRIRPDARSWALRLGYGFMWRIRGKGCLCILQRSSPHFAYRLPDAKKWAAPVQPPPCLASKNSLGFLDGMRHCDLAGFLKALQLFTLFGVRY